jgi:hypothetical protein
MKLNATKEFIQIVSTIKIKSGELLMVEMNNNPFGGIGLGKKRMLPSEIAHKFSSKDDFLNFFSKQVSNFSKR